MKKTTQNKIIKLLLICSILSTLLYISADFICSVVYPSYSYADQAISELSAIGSPTTSLWKTLTFMFSPLIIAFGIGVFIVGKKRSLKVTGILLLLFGISGYAWLFFPMNMRGNIGGASDTGHLVLSAITVLLLTLILGFGSGAKGKKFRIYSILTMIIMLFFGFLVGTMAPKVAAQEPTPWMGIFERISVFSPMIWIMVLGIILLKNENEIKQVVRYKR
ncbi:Uncharacterised protein [uncultured archaeon]|nr:Uncharacterised protein [uncultured archaeon]